MISRLIISFSLLETGSHYAAQAGLKLTVLLPQPPKNWDHRHYTWLAVNIFQYPLYIWPKSWFKGGCLMAQAPKGERTRSLPFLQLPVQGWFFAVLVSLLLTTTLKSISSLMMLASPCSHRKGAGACEAQNVGLLALELERSGFHLGSTTFPFPCLNCSAPSKTLAELADASLNVSCCCGLWFLLRNSSQPAAPCGWLHIPAQPAKVSDQTMSHRPCAQQTWILGPKMFTHQMCVPGLCLIGCTCPLASQSLVLLCLWIFHPQLTCQAWSPRCVPWSWREESGSSWASAH
jgi:hypothetical protein